jgi:hypothetical protein
LDIFLVFSQNVNRSNLSKQAFISIFQNEYFIEEVVNLLRTYLDSETLDYEAHIVLIIEILFSVFSEGNRTVDVLLLLYGSAFYEVLNKLKAKMISLYDSTETDPTIKDFFMRLDAIIDFLYPVNLFNESKEVKALMSYINDNCFNNIQKYNLNEKPINEDNIKDDNIKDYVKSLKLNILNYFNHDVDYLETVRKKDSLINELFAAVRIVNLSVTILNNLISLFLLPT